LDSEGVLELISWVLQLTSLSSEKVQNEKKKKWDGGSFKDVMKEDERLETHIKRNRQWEIESPSEGR